MNVLIVGATGRVGGQTLSYALRANHPVTAFGRSIENINTQHENLSVVKGDVLQTGDVDQAMRGQDVVILTFGAPLTADTLLHQPSLTEEGTRHVIAAMKREGVPRLICMTALRAGNSEGHGRFMFRNFIEPVLLGRIMKDRTEQEELVRTSGLPEWMIVRPTELSDDKTAPVRVIEDLESEPEPTTISRQDVGRILVSMIADKRYDGKTIVITNDDKKEIYNEPDYISTVTARSQTQPIKIKQFHRLIQTFSTMTFVSDLAYFNNFSSNN